MSEQLNFILWQVFFWSMPVIGGILYIRLCKKGYFEDSEETTGKEGATK